jgi:hypothetical protein
LDVIVLNSNPSVIAGHAFDCINLVGFNSDSSYTMDLSSLFSDDKISVHFQNFHRIFEDMSFLTSLLVILM